MDDAKLFIICATLVIISIMASVTVYNYNLNVTMSRNIENGIVKGIDPVAIRCAYAQSNDNICVAYAATKSHEVPRSGK